MWQNRGLSLIDKIALTNTLMASILVHRMMVMPNMPEKTERCYDKIVSDFLWNKGKAKIPREVLMANKSDGGLALVDMKNRDRAFKISWIFKLENNDKVRTLAEELLQNPIGGLALAGKFKT